MNDTAVEPNGVVTTSGEPQQRETPIPVLELNEGETDLLRSLTRLAVGGALIGLDELRAHLAAWEAEAKETPAAQDARAATAAAQRNASQGGNTSVAGSVEGIADGNLSDDWVRHAFLGLLFESQSRWAKRRKAFRARAGRRAEVVLTPLFKRLDESPRLRPAQSRFEALVESGETITGRWVARGRNEEAHSRKLVLTAANQLFSDSMNELGQAPALQELVRRQSAGLTQDALDEVRERTVSGDILAEHLARRLLRRMPRRELPVPPTAEEARASTRD